jgi:hypothetical protein
MHEFVLFLLAASTMFMAINAGQQKNCTSPTVVTSKGLSLLLTTKVAVLQFVCSAPPKLQLFLLH